MVCVKGADRPVSNFGGGLVLFLHYGEDVGELAVQGLDYPAQVVAIQAANFVFVVAVNDVILDSSTFRKIIPTDAVGI